MSINAIAENSARIDGNNLSGSMGRVGGGEDSDFMTQLLKQLLAANDDKSGLSDLLGQLGAKSSGGACSSGGCGSNSGGGANSSNGGACGSNAAQASCGGCGCGGGAQNLANNLQFQ